jgi:hypothetical protein
MRRSEERLGYWLSQTASSLAQDLEPDWKKKLLAKLRGLEPRPAIGEQSLEISTSTIDLESELSADAHVQDGLGVLAPATGIPDEIDPCLSKITEIDLVNSTSVHAVVFPDGRNTRVLGAKLLPTPNIRLFTMHLHAGMVRAVGNLRTVPVVDGNPLLLATPLIQGRLTPIAVMPHRRTSVNTDTLQDAERREFLHQAHLLKHVRSEDGEVIAVFRHVPIEVVTSLRYVTEEGAIVYSVSAEPRRSRTRVHDMAAVRDNATGEVHLIPRRTHVSVELRITN